ncbi:IS66 family transposase zinc-finger binding domain-containing protein [Bradyrhizobium sp. USDA 4506]
MVRIGEDRSRRLDVTPAQYRVVEAVRPRYACAQDAPACARRRRPPIWWRGGLPTQAMLA